MEGRKKNAHTHTYREEKCQKRVVKSWLAGKLKLKLNQRLHATQRTSHNVENSTATRATTSVATRVSCAIWGSGRRTCPVSLSVVCQSVREHWIRITRPRWNQNQNRVTTCQRQRQRQRQRLRPRGIWEYERAECATHVVVVVRCCSRCCLCLGLCLGLTLASSGLSDFGPAWLVENVGKTNRVSSRARPQPAPCPKHSEKFCYNFCGCHFVLWFGNMFRVEGAAQQGVLYCNKRALLLLNSNRIALCPDPEWEMSSTCNEKCVIFG